MLRLSNAFYEQDILSLRSGGVVGHVSKPIINPNNLKIEGWHAADSIEKGAFVLPTSEVRDFISKGIVVNDHDALTHPEDLVRMKEVLQIRFELVGKQVVTDRKRRVGKVNDFAVNDGFYVQKLYVSPSVLKGLTQDQRIIDRSIILEITDKKIVVSDSSEAKSGALQPSAASADI